MTTSGKPVITGSRAQPEEALASVIKALVDLGLVEDKTIAVAPRPAGLAPSPMPFGFPDGSFGLPPGLRPGPGPVMTHGGAPPPMPRPIPPAPAAPAPPGPSQGLQVPELQRR